MDKSMKEQFDFVSMQFARKNPFHFFEDDFLLFFPPLVLFLSDSAIILRQSSSDSSSGFNPLGIL